MASNIIQEIEKEQMRKDPLSPFGVGDTVKVARSIVEGKKKRTQYFEGIVIKKQKKHSRESFTVRKVIDGIGVERMFLVHSPLLTEIQVIKKGSVRRAKLHYLRERLGSKMMRIKEKEQIVEEQ